MGWPRFIAYWFASVTSFCAIGSLARVRNLPEYLVLALYLAASGSGIFFAKKKSIGNYKTTIILFSGAIWGALSI